MFRPVFRSPLLRARSSAQTCRMQLHTLRVRVVAFHDEYCMLKQTKQTYHAFRAAEAKHPRFVAAVCVTSCRQFHSSRPNEGLHFVPLLAGILKSSTAIEILRTTARIALTFAPFLWFKSMRAKRIMKIAHERGDTKLIERMNKYMSVQAVRRRAIIMYSMTFVPLFILFAMIVASLERTPLTGRWRLILLSPEEEDNIASQLAGSGWYQAVADILAQEGTPPHLIPATDWRLHWVRDTLRRLERVIPLLQREHELEAKWLECGPNDIPLPPPAEYPLRPRPRGSEVVRQFAELSCGRRTLPTPHVIPGPPYSLIVVDKPDSSNAFSYGFGPDGGGGIVVFSGFIDDILAKYPPAPSTPLTQEVSWLTFLFGGLPSTPPAPHPIPTEQQTSELAILLAHELSHLILSHHLETLSSGSIIWPGLLSISTDVVRAVLFPITMLFGPFVNDALAGVGKLGSGHLTQLTQYCTSQRQEVEADVVSARLLAHAGFDPRHAIRFWEGRQETIRTAECSPARAAERFEQNSAESLPMRWVGQSHPMNVVRVERLKEELRRWELQREAARLKLRQGAHP